MLTGRPLLGALMKEMSVSVPRFQFYFLSPKPRFCFCELVWFWFWKWRRFPNLYPMKKKFIAKVGRKKPSGAQPDPEE
jgi:hypothetical protein